MFVHLHCHSHYSFLRGVNPPEEIIAAAAQQQMPAVALTDTDGMYAAVPFYQKAKAAGIKPIVGVTLDVAFAAENPTQNMTVPLVLLATDSSGYSNLCRLTTLRHLGELRPTQETFAQDTGRPVTIDELAAHSDGVIALYPSALSFRAQLAKRDAHISARLKNIFTNRLYLEVQHLSSGDGRTLREGSASAAI